MSTYCHRDVLYFDQLVGQIINNSIKKWHNEMIIIAALSAILQMRSISLVNIVHLILINELILFYHGIIDNIMYITKYMFINLDYSMH